MTTRRKDETAAPPKGQDDPAGKKLLTSDDLFGDMVDGPVPPRKEAAATVAGRKGPIKVQVSEPGAARKGPLTSPPAGEKLPEDVAALLDAFSEPAESALREETYSEAPGLEELVDEDVVPATAEPEAEEAPEGMELVEALAEAAPEATAVDDDGTVDVDETIPPPAKVKPQPA